MEYFAYIYLQKNNIIFCEKHWLMRGLGIYVIR